MTDRRNSMYSPQGNTYSPAQWSPVDQAYASSSTHYTPAYHDHNTPSHHRAPQADASGSPAYQGVYYPTSSSYTHSGNAVQQSYPSISPTLSPVTSSQRQSHSRTQSSQSYAHAQAPYGHVQPVAHSHSRPRSHSQAHPYMPSSSPAIDASYPAAQYPQQVPLSPAYNISPQFPASPARPFSCDMCALSFNRQHDLKRHRETHTGEKPFLCNGGCGKTFTRKDALKRHQLVKNCGKVDDMWP
ncbi:hypothetical protein EYR38_006631 [Pleurotus pulmonarius]|nr:hypothetical protein EYR38_006631 [Pleurotus pulmonarius]